MLGTPARQRSGLLYPRRYLRFADITLMNVDPARVLARTSGWNRSQRRAADFDTSGSRRGALHWLCAARSGTAITGFESSDGVTWTLVGTVSISMTNPVQIGLAMTSHHNAVTCTAIFDQLVITASGSG